MRRKPAFTKLELQSANAVFEYQVGAPERWGHVRHTTHELFIPPGHRGAYITECNNTVVHTVKMEANDDIEDWEHAHMQRAEHEHH